MNSNLPEIKNAPVYLVLSMAEIKALVRDARRALKVTIAARPDGFVARHPEAFCVIFNGFASRMRPEAPEIQVHSHDFRVTNFSREALDAVKL